MPGTIEAFYLLKIKSLLRHFRPQRWHKFIYKLVWNLLVVMSSLSLCLFLYLYLYPYLSIHLSICLYHLTFLPCSDSRPLFGVLAVCKRIWLYFLYWKALRCFFLSFQSTDSQKRNSVSLGSYWQMLSGESKVRKLPSHVQPFVTPWTIAHQAPLSLEFSKQEHWNGLPFPLQRIFLTQRPNLGLLPGQSQPLNFMAFL